METEKKADPGRETKREITTIEIVGMVVLFLFLGTIFFKPEFLSELFQAMFNKILEVPIQLFLTGMVGVAIIASVIIGRILERLGFTDALIRIFVGLANKLNFNSAIIIPGVYNILGDINAAGKIAGPILVKAGATKDEQKIAVATMVQSQQSFSTFMLGMLALGIAGIRVFPVIIIAVFLPLIVVPVILKYTLYRDTKGVKLEVLPRFTPTTGALPTLFGAAREGVELLLLLIIPAAAAIFGIIGALEYIGVWAPFQTWLGSVLQFLSIDPETGVIAIVAAPTLAMAMLVESAANIEPRLVVGSFILASSGLPLSVIFGQIPTVWAEITDLSEKEALYAALLGTGMRVVTALIVALLLTPLLI